MHLLGVSAQAVNHRLRATVLPHDAGRQRLPGGRVPGEDRLALVGQRDSLDGPASLGDGLTAGLDHGPVERHRIHLHTAVGQVVRGDGLFYDGVDAVVVDDDRLGTRGSLI